MKNRFKNQVLRGLTLILAFISFVSCNNGQSNAQTVNPPKQIISVDQARIMYDTYSTRRVPIIEAYEKQIDSTPFVATRCIQYDFETLKQYMVYVEQEAEKAGVAISSMKIYLANYPNQPKFTDGKVIKDARRNTIFLTPTMLVNGEELAFYIVKGEDGKSTAVPIKDKTKEMNTETGAINGIEKVDVQTASMLNISQTKPTGTNLSLILNDGTNMPPPKGSDFGN